jgi:DnaD/phage-associated family protein
MKWFRFYSEARHDPKIQRMPLLMRWQWMEILCLANEGNPRGYIDGDPNNVAYSLRIKPASAQALLSELTERKLLDRDGAGYRPHNWDSRQPNSDNAAERMRRTRSEDVPNKFVLDTDKTRTEQNREEETRQQQTPQLLRPNIFTLCEQAFGPRLTPQLKAALEEAEKEYPANWIEEAFREAALSGGRSWRYVEKILQTWKTEEERDIAEAKRHGLEGEAAVAFANAKAERNG